MGSKSGPKIPDPAKQLPFAGLRTPTFSLQRTTQPVTRTITSPGQPSLRRGGPNEQRNPSTPSTTTQTVTETTPGQGPFQLRRTDNTVPRLESSLLNRTRALAPQIRSLRPGITALGTRFSDLFGQSRERLEGLLDEVRPAFGRITDARVAAIERNRSRTLGDLREAFGKRNVLGASFAQAEIRRADQEFAQLESEARAQATLEELETSQSIIQGMTSLDALDFATQGETLGLLNENFRLELTTLVQEHSIVTQRAQRELEELRIAGGIITGHDQIAANLATAQAQLAAQEASDSGTLLGTIVGAGARIGAAALLA